MIRTAIRIIIFFLFTTNFIYAENTKVDSLLKIASQQVKSSKLKKAVQTLIKVEKNAIKEIDKTEIDKIYQLIIKAYLIDLDYVSAFDIQKKRIDNLTKLYELKSQNKIEILEKKLQNKTKQSTKNIKKNKKNTLLEVSNNAQSNYYALFIVIALILLVILIYVFYTKTKKITELKKLIHNNNASVNLTANSNNYNIIELNNKINYLQQQINIKNEEEVIFKKNAVNLNNNISQLKKDLLVKEENILELKKAVSKNLTHSPSINIEKYIFPNSEFLKHLFTNHFIFSKTINNNSSNLYWFDSIEGRVYFAMVQIKNISDVAVQYLIFSMLNRSIHEYGKEKPAEILRQINASWLEFLITQNSNYLNNLEIAMSVCCYNIFTKELEFAGANHSIFIIREKIPSEKALFILNADSNSICKESAEKQFAFTNQILETLEGDRLFLLNDLITNKNTSFFNTNNLQALFLQNANKPINNTFNELENQFNKIETNNIDLLIIGIDL